MYSYISNKYGNDPLVFEDIQEAENFLRDCFPEEEILLEERGGCEVYDQDGDLILEITVESFED